MWRVLRRFEFQLVAIVAYELMIVYMRDALITKEHDVLYSPD